MIPAAINPAVTTVSCCASVIVLMIPLVATGPVGPIEPMTTDASGGASGASLWK